MLPRAGYEHLYGCLYKRTHERLYELLYECLLGCIVDVDGEDKELRRDMVKETREGERGVVREPSLSGAPRSG